MTDVQVEPVVQHVKNSVTLLRTKNEQQEKTDPNTKIRNTIINDESKGSEPQNTNYETELTNCTFGNCNKQFLSTVGLKNHMHVHNRKVSFNCPACFRCFRLIGDFKQHFLTCHNPSETANICSSGNCNKHFLSSAALKKYMVVHKRKGSFKCPVCCRCFRLNRKFKLHLKTHSENGITKTVELTNICTYDNCNRQFKSPAGLRIHMHAHESHVHSSKVPIKCPICSRCFLLKRDFKRHFKTWHNLPETAGAEMPIHQSPRKYLSAKLEEADRMKTLESNSKITTNNTQENLIDEIKQEYNNKKDEKNDPMEVAVVQPFKVENDEEISPSSFEITATNERGDSIYEVKHEYQENEKDNLLNIAIAASIKIENDEQINTTETTIKVQDDLMFIAESIQPENDEEIKTNSWLNSQNQPLESEKYTYTCTLENCKRKFQSAIALDNHIRIHNNERPVKCVLCTAWFRSKSTLTQHFRTCHSSQKKPGYFCKFGTLKTCSQEFPTLARLHNHTRTDHADMKLSKFVLGHHYVRSRSDLKRHFIEGDHNPQKTTFKLHHLETNDNHLKTLEDNNQKKRRSSSEITATSVQNYFTNKHKNKVEKEIWEDDLENITGIQPIQIENDEMSPISSEITTNTKKSGLVKKKKFKYKEDEIVFLDFVAEDMEIENDEEMATSSKRVHPCTWKNCHKVFEHATELKYHIGVHTVETPFTCSSCASCFRSPQDLTRHFVINHTEMKEKTNDVNATVNKLKTGTEIIEIESDVEGSEILQKIKSENEQKIEESNDEIQHKTQITNILDSVNTNASTDSNKVNANGLNNDNASLTIYKLETATEIIEIESDDEGSEILQKIKCENKQKIEESNNEVQHKTQITNILDGVNTDASTDSNTVFANGLENDNASATVNKLEKATEIIKIECDDQTSEILQKIKCENEQKIEESNNEIQHKTQTTNILDGVNTDASTDSNKVNATGLKDVPPFVCTVPNCNKIFNTRSRLNYHIGDHTNPFKCYKCNECFGSSFNLRRHFMLTHNFQKTADSQTFILDSEPKYKCGVCNKTFIRRRNFILHCATQHTKVKCSQCYKICATQADLKKHTKRYHTILVMEESEKKITNRQREINDANAIVNKLETATEMTEIDSNDEGPEILQKIGSETDQKIEESSNEIQDKTQITNMDGVNIDASTDLNKVNANGLEKITKVQLHKAESIQNDSTKCNKKEKNKVRRLFVCTVANCNKKYTTLRGLEYHRLAYNTEKHFKCYTCNRYFHSKVDLKRHFMVTHNFQKTAGGRPFVCTVANCNKNYTSPSGLWYHRRVHNHEKPIKCYKCNIRVGSKAKLIRHYMEMHNRQKGGDGQPFVCTVANCNKKYASRFGLEYHRRTHNNEKPFKCLKCNKCFRSKMNLKQHSIVPHIFQKTTIKEKTITNEEAHVTEQDKDCNSSASSSIDDNKIPSTKRDDQNRFQCKICKKQFRDSWKLKTHIVIHTREKQYECSECDKKYQWKYSLRIHIARDHRHKRLVSKKIASETINESSNILDRQRFACTVVNCNKKYTSRLGLEYHIRAHNNEKPFKCHKCNRCFRSKTSLKLHIIAKHNHQKTAKEQENQNIVSKLKIDQPNDSLQEFRKCNECGKTFSTSEALNIHKELFHDSNEFEKQPVPKFEMTPANIQSDLLDEIKIELDEIKVENIELAKLGVTEDTNIVTNEDVPPFVCTVADCTKKYKSRSGRVYDNVNHYKCNTCNKHFPSKRNLKQHLKLTQNHQKTADVPLFACTIADCNKKYTSRTGLDYHLRAYDNESKHFKCNICNTYFPSKVNLNQHLMVTHNFQKTADDRLFVCIVANCNKKYTTLRGLEYHLRDHNNELPFKCDKCNRCFRSKVNLKQHLRVTHGFQKTADDRLFVCIVANCNKKYTTLRGLEYHLRDHNNELPFKCDKCNRCFRSKVNLKQHLRVTHGFQKTADRQPFACTVVNCNKKYTSRLGLEYHIRAHNNEKPFKCHKCNRCFRSKMTLKLHIMAKHNHQKTAKMANVQLRKAESIKHSSTKCNKKVKNKDGQAFACTVANCNKKYKSRYHRRAHNNEKPFKCHKCNKCFRSTRNLKQHSMMTHNFQKTAIMPDTSDKTEITQHCNSMEEINKECENIEVKKIDISQTNKTECVNTEQDKDNQNKCPSCGRCFLFTSNLKLHLGLMDELKKNIVNCHLCEATFKSKACFRYHLRVNHGDNYESELSECSSKKSASNKLDLVEMATAVHIKLDDEVHPGDSTATSVPVDKCYSESICKEEIIFFD